MKKSSIKREKAFTLDLSVKEHETLFKRAKECGLTPTDFIRSVINGTVITQKQFYKVIKPLAKEIAELCVEHARLARLVKIYREQSKKLDQLLEITKVK